MEIKNICIDKENNLEGKRILVRVGVNVPINKKEKKIESDFRLKKILPTIKFLIEKKAKIILIGHIGRDPKMNLKLVYEWFKKQDIDILFDKYTFDNFSKKKEEKVLNIISKMRNGQVLLLDNLRQTEMEKENNYEFSEKISKFGDIYVNEAFSVSHRPHASIIGVPTFFNKKYIGILFEKEIENVNKILNPKNNSLAILGGAKIKTKLPLISEISKKFDLTILGGGIVNNFYKFLGYEIGESIVDNNFLDLNKYISKKIFIPNITIVKNRRGKISEKEINDVLKTDNILDVSPNSFIEIEDKIKEAEFVFFNGPMGYYEGGFVDGTKYLLEHLANDKNYFIAGGGDTADVIFELGLEKNVDWISTGGGALIDFISNGKLVGLDAIIKK